MVLRSKREGRWTELSYGELADRVQDLSVGLIELGVAPGDRVALLSENRPEWAITDFACLAARYTDVPIYPTLPPKQAEYVLRDSSAVAVLVSTAAQVEKVLAARERLPALRHVIAFNAAAVRPGVLSVDAVWRSDARRADGTPVGESRHSARTPMISPR